MLRNSIASIPEIVSREWFRSRPESMGVSHQRVQVLLEAMSLDSRLRWNDGVGETTRIKTMPH